MPKERRPGDQIIDRYAPHLTPEDRELAHERLRAFARALIRADRERAAEATAPDSTLSASKGTIPPSPPFV